ncbi:MAG: ATP-dependent DNA helicase RecQ, partial [Bacteroidetes bacterium]
MILKENELYQTLRKFFGFSEFKGLQKEAIGALLSGRDTFVIMPTGGGKSLCYQLPALMCEGTAIVISPLIALMKNQVDAIRSQSAVSGIAHVLNSSLTKTETQAVINDLKSGVTKLLFVAPESLTKQHNIDLLKSIPLSFVAIDEAHCISEWGHDFRPEYRNIRAIIDRLSPGIPLIALTATATPKVQEDIMKNLGMKDALLLKSSFNRPNLYYEVRPKTDEVNSDIVKLIAQHPNKSVIIYCLSRKRVEELAQILQLNGIKAIPYHAGFDAKTRALYQDQFLMEDVDVVVATIAFGMGIDKPDVRLVIHYDMPKSIESYYQETGRAGRDGGEGICIAFYSSKDIEKLEKFSSGKPVAEQEVSQALLQDVIAYAETSLSRRKFILHYFGEEFDEVNGEGADMDDNARNPKELFEAGEEATLVLDVVQKTSEKFKSKEIVRILRGKPNAMISSHKTDEKPFFGCGHAHKSFFWHALVRQLVIAGYLRKSIESYGILQITEK